MGGGEVGIREGKNTCLHRVSGVLVLILKSYFWAGSYTHFTHRSSGYHKSDGDERDHYTVKVRVRGRMSRRKHHVYGEVSWIIFLMWIKIWYICIFSRHLLELERMIYAFCRCLALLCALSLLFSALQLLCHSVLCSVSYTYVVLRIAHKHRVPNTSAIVTRAENIIYNYSTRYQ